MLSAGILIALPVFTRGQQKIEPEILESWKRYKAKLSHAQGEYSGTSKRRHGTDSSVGNVEVKFAFTSGCQRVELVETETGTVKPSRQLICRNPKYSFRLDLRENGWLLREVVMAGEEPSSVRDSLHDKLDAWLACLNCLNAIERTQLLDLADDLRWTEPQEGQTKALNLIKERRLKSGPNTITYHKLSLQLNADHYHTLQSARAEWLMNKTEGILEITASQQMNGGIPVPTRLVSRQTYPTIPGGDLEITTDTSFRIDPSVELPDQDFTLTAYGLPEPVGITWSKPTPNYVWPLVAAGGCVVLALGFRFLARRRAAAATS